MLLPLNIAPGVYRNGTDYQSKGRWRDASLVRWYENTMRPVGGWRKRSNNQFSGKCRGLIAWRNNSHVRWIGIGTHSKLYAMAESGALTDITPSGYTVGDADAVKSTRLGFRNIARVMKLMEPAATADKTADFSLLRQTYGAIVGQWATEAGHVQKVVGAVQQQQKVAGQAGPVWVPVTKARQQEAMRFLNDEVFTTPRYLIDAPVLARLESDGNIGRIAGAQARVLGSLVANQKLQRMVEVEAVAANKAEVYTLGEMLTDLRRGLWKEAYAGQAVDAYRRRLQLTYLEAMASKIRPAATPTVQLPPGFGPVVVNPRDFRGLLKDEMRILDRELAAAIPRTGDRATRAHLQDARDQIKEMLDPKN